MRYRELAKRLRKLGCHEMHTGKGSTASGITRLRGGWLPFQIGVPKIWPLAPFAPLSASWVSAVASLAPSSNTIPQYSHNQRQRMGGQESERIVGSR